MTERASARPKGSVLGGIGAVLLAAFFVWPFFVGGFTVADPQAHPGGPPRFFAALFFGVTLTAVILWELRKQEPAMSPLEALLLSGMEPAKALRVAGSMRVQLRDPDRRLFSRILGGSGDTGGVVVDDESLVLRTSWIRGGLLLGIVFCNLILAYSLGVRVSLLGILVLASLFGTATSSRRIPFASIGRAERTGGRLRLDLRDGTPAVEIEATEPTLDRLCAGFAGRVPVQVVRAFPPISAETAARLDEALARLPS